MDKSFYKLGFVWLVIAALASTARASEYSRTNNQIGPSIQAGPITSAVSDSITLRVWSFSGATPYTFAGTTNPLALLDVPTGIERFRVNPTGTDSNSILWNISLPRTGLGVGTYRLYGRSYSTGNSNLVGTLEDVQLVITADPTASCPDVTVSNAISSVAISLVPLTSNTGSIGTQTLPWNQIQASTGTFSTLVVGTLDVGGTVSAIDTNAVRRSGDTMVGPLTGTVIYATSFVGAHTGNGVGLTNLTVSQTGQVNYLVGANTNQVLKWDGTTWTNAEDITGAGAADTAVWCRVLAPGANTTGNFVFAGGAWTKLTNMTQLVGASDPSIYNPTTFVWTLPLTGSYQYVFDMNAQGSFPFGVSPRRASDSNWIPYTALTATTYQHNGEAFLQYGGADGGVVGGIFVLTSAPQSVLFAFKGGSGGNAWGHQLWLWRLHDIP